MRTLLLRFLAILFVPASLVAQEPVPAPPPSHVLDKANVLLPESAARLSGQLVAAERENSIHVYLVTFPSMKSSASLQQSKLEEAANLYAAEWTKDVIGTVITFDDESGLVSIAYSKEAEKEYTSLELDLALKAPLRETQEGGKKRDQLLDRDKLERTTSIVLGTLKSFQEKTASKSRRQSLMIIGVVFFVLIAVGLELLVASTQKEDTADSKSEAEDRAGTGSP